MGSISGFKNQKRNTEKRKPVNERVQNWQEIYVPWTKEEAKIQASRCMDCGVPFCNNGCPLGNLLPEFNDLVYKEDWESAYLRLSATNNFPEFTGRICPAPCEASCTLSINNDPVSIEMIEKNIIEKAWESGLVKPEPPKNRTGKKIAIIGSGPAGLAVAQQLNRAGHEITIYEKNEHPGGLLRFGIPEFKLEKAIVERRINLLAEEGINFECSVNAGIDITANELMEKYDSICLAGGSTVPRDLPIKGRDLEGVHFAMDFLSEQNRWNENPKDREITAKNKNVVIIGGGDTGADCLGTSIRQGAKSITQIEIMPEPPEGRSKDNPWPEWPMILRTSSAHEEGGDRQYSILTSEFSGTKSLEKLICEKVEWKKDKSGRYNMEKVDNSHFEIKSELVLLAMGFVHPLQEGLLSNLDVEFDERGNVKTDNNMMTNVSKVFSCGDMERGQSLVVHAIASGRSCAKNIDTFLQGSSNLPDVRGYYRKIN